MQPMLRHYLAAKAKKAAGDVLGTIVSLSQAITIKEDFAEALLLEGRDDAVYSGL